MGVDVFANDWYYSGGADAITGLNVVPLGERYYTIFGNGDAGLTELPARSGALPFGVIDFGDQMNATENGLYRYMVPVRGGQRGPGLDHQLISVPQAPVSSRESGLVG